MAKTFGSETDFVKLHIMSLAAKFYLTFHYDLLKQNQAPLIDLESNENAENVAPDESSESKDKEKGKETAAKDKKKNNHELATFDKERMKLLINYIFQLAKYDLNYDVRDRGRFLKQIINNCENNEPNALKTAQKILLTPKLNEINDNWNTDCGLINYNRINWRVGTMSHFVARAVEGIAVQIVLLFAG